MSPLTEALQALDKPALLIVDSDKMICSLLQYNLTRDYRVDVVGTAAEVMHLDLLKYSLVLMDIDLEGGVDGLQLARHLHDTPACEGVPLIFCTARDSEDDICAGFDAGADDYIVKPFSLRELAARVRSVIRRHSLSRSLAMRQAEKAPASIEVEGLKIHFEGQTVEADGEPVALSRTEFMILALLAREPGVVFSRDEIHRRVWGAEAAAQGNSRAVDVNISRLRKKLGARGSHISSRQGLGYCFV